MKLSERDIGILKGKIANVVSTQTPHKTTIQDEDGVVYGTISTRIEPGDDDQLRLRIRLTPANKLAGNETYWIPTERVGPSLKNVIAYLRTIDLSDPNAAPEQPRVSIVSLAPLRGWRRCQSARDGVT